MSMGMTAADICNQALARLGAEKILGLEDGSKGARFCRLFYEQTRDEVLRSHPWNFAMKREVLSRLADEPMFDWSRRYQLPGDFVRLVQLNAYGEAEAARNSEIEGSTLLCDEETAQIRYVCRVEDAALFDPLFVEALAVKLASKLAQPLTGSRNLGAEILQEYERVTAPLARRVDSQEDRPRKKQPWVESAFVRARRGPIPARGTSFVPPAAIASPQTEADWERNDEGDFVANVLAYGAKGDGLSDDHAAIAAAVGAVKANGFGGVHFPGGRTYRIATKGRHGIHLDRISHIHFTMGEGSVLFMDNLEGSEPTGHGCFIEGPCEDISFRGMRIRFASMPESVRIWSGWYCLGANIGDGDRTNNVPAWYRGDSAGGQNTAAMHAGAIRNIRFHDCGAENVSNAFVSLNGVDGAVIENFDGRHGYGSGIYCQAFRRLHISKVRLDGIDDDGIALLSNEGGTSGNEIEDDFHGEWTTVSDVVINEKLDHPFSVPSGGLAIAGVRDVAVTNYVINRKFRGIKIEYGTQGSPGDPYAGLGIHFLASRRIALSNFTITNCTNPIFFLNKENTLETDPKWWKSAVRMENIVCDRNDYLFVTDALVDAPEKMELVSGVTMSGIRSSGERTGFATLKNAQDVRIDGLETEGELTISGFVPYGEDPDGDYAESDLFLNGVQCRELTLSGVKRAYIDNLTSMKSPTYGIRLLGCSDIVATTIRAIDINRTETAFRDGLFLDGNCRRFTCEEYEFRQDAGAFASALSINGEEDRFIRLRHVRVQTATNQAGNYCFDEPFNNTGVNSIKRIDWIHYAEEPMTFWRRRETPDERLITGDFADADASLYVDSHWDVYRLTTPLSRDVQITYGRALATAGCVKTFIKFPSATGDHKIELLTETDSAPAVFYTIPPEVSGTVDVQFNGTRWEMLRSTVPESAGVGGDVGDNNVTLTVGNSPGVVRFITPLTSNRAVTLSTTGAKNGSKFRILRVNSNTRTVNVGGIKTLPANIDSWLDVEYEGFAWIVTGFGSL